MFVLAEIIKGIGLLASLVFDILFFLLVVRIILSWVNPDPYNEFVKIVYRITDPILGPFRRLPLQMGGIDLSPILVFILLSVLRNVVLNVIYQFALKLV
ncbi:MAG: YggT family protein [Candidatus Omnitrophica bacterium]|nr:YggT family protein [Candidatus Omnitrophota bacterium]MDD5488359.1 YggT family protein [Candidatus Omnitrophota bacterium]